MKLKQICKMMMLFATLTPFTMAQAPAPAGQAPQTPEARIQARVKALGDFVFLTDAQKQQMTTLLTDADKASTPLRADMSALRLDLRKAVRSNDAAAIEKIGAEIGAIEGKVTGMGAKTNGAIYALLTADQKAKLDTATSADTSLRPLGIGLAPAAAPAPAPAPAPAR